MLRSRASSAASRSMRAIPPHPSRRGLPIVSCPPSPFETLAPPAPQDEGGPRITPARQDEAARARAASHPGQQEARTRSPVLFACFFVPAERASRRAQGACEAPASLGRRSPLGAPPWRFWAGRALFPHRTYVRIGSPAHSSHAGRIVAGGRVPSPNGERLRAA